MTAPRRNQRFAHAKLTGPDGGPAVCVITDVRRDRVRYRNADGAVYSKPADVFDRVVLRYLDDDEA